MLNIQLQVNRSLHQIRNIISRMRLKNKSVTIISSNCVGGVMYHDLHLPFTSPTINLFFEPDSFLKYVENLEYYNDKEVVDVTNGASYPVGRIGDVELHFLHYNPFEEAKESWNRRKKRINYDNIVIVMTDQGVKSSEVVKRFDKIEYRKVYLTNKHLKYAWSEYIPGFDEDDSVGNTIPYCHGGKRFYEQFDYVAFLNGDTK